MCYQCRVTQILKCLQMLFIQCEILLDKDNFKVLYFQVVRRSVGQFLTWAGLDNVLDTRVDNRLFVPLQFQLHIFCTLLHMWYLYRNDNCHCNNVQWGHEKCQIKDESHNVTLIHFKLNQGRREETALSEEWTKSRQFFFYRLTSKQ